MQLNFVQAFYANYLKMYDIESCFGFNKFTYTFFVSVIVSSTKCYCVIFQFLIPLCLKQETSFLAVFITLINSSNKKHKSKEIHSILLKWENWPKPNLKLIVLYFSENDLAYLKFSSWRLRKCWTWRKKWCYYCTIDMVILIHKMLYCFIIVK